MPKRPQGAPKLKWTEEEELALKAGVDKCVMLSALLLVWASRLQNGFAEAST